jgi:3-deoxy-D-manno-octulosonic-acid transferase
MLLYLYNALLALSTPLFPLIKLSARKRGELKLLPRLKPDFPQAKGKFLLHAASVGEVNSLKPLIELLTPEAALTVFTDYGLKRARQLYPQVPSRVLPLDLLPVTRRFLRSAAPKALIVYESEVWPSLLKAATELKVPVYFVSGKISQRAFGRLIKFKKLLSPLLGQCRFLARWEEDAERARELGFKEVKVVGDLKLDYSPPKKLPPFEAEGRTVLLWGSTHPGEEELAQEVHFRLKRELPNLLTVIAPRHTGRKIKLRGKTVKRSQTVKVPPEADFYLIDTVGELPGLYGYADVAVVGGSFVNGVGGHNPVEPVALKKATTVGPKNYAFKEICERLKVPSVNERELPSRLLELLKNHNLRERAARESYRRWEKERGVSVKIVKELKRSERAEEESP